MIEYENAVKRVVARASHLPVISVSLKKALGHCLAADVKTTSLIPRFDSSGVDGYAVRTRDIAKASKEKPAVLNISKTIRAGDVSPATLSPGRAIRILTGAPIPSAADTVVMQEFVSEKDGRIVVTSPQRKGKNIRGAGEEYAKGELALQKGMLITPSVVGLLATLGCTRVRVFRKPRIAVIVSGNELRRPSGRLRRGEIYDSNSYALSAALASLGTKPVISVRVRDDKKKMLAEFRRAFEKADVVISSGGVSAGEYDFVKEISGQLGIKQVFWKVAIKPGKPNFFGVHGKKLFFGLPGNPVAALLSFQLLVRPALDKIMGRSHPSSFWLSARLRTEAEKKPGRVEFIRGVLTTDDGGASWVEPTRGQDSHMMGGLAAANCIVYFPKEASRLKSGEMVSVNMLRWSLS
jgi:molybdopterin molybdotransferase